MLGRANRLLRLLRDGVPVSDSNGPMTAWSGPTRSSVCSIYMKAGWRRKHRNSWRRFPEREGG